uniref:Sb:cb470 n=1 Tax=Salmo trutta TaxID=8032 RepID=A0A673Z435_SALTR
MGKIENKQTPNDFVPLSKYCVGIAAARTQEYLLFPWTQRTCSSPTALNEIFLITYITQSSHLHMTDSSNSTAMTKQQRIFLGADWMWAIAVQILCLTERGRDGRGLPPRWYILNPCKMAKTESANRNKAERMVDFCVSIGNDCYSLFLLWPQGRLRQHL